MAGPEIDMAGAVALAAGMGVEPPTAAALLAACAEGLRLAQADVREKREAEDGGED